MAKMALSALGQAGVGAWANGADQGGVAGVFSGISIDVTTLKPGDLFVLHWPSCGQEPIDQTDIDVRGELSARSETLPAVLSSAVAKGASAVIVAHEVSCPLPESVPCLRVADIEQALKAIAQLWVAEQQSERLKKIIISGNCGKSTVCALIAAILGKRRSVLVVPPQAASMLVGQVRTQDVALALALMQLTPKHEALVIELAAGLTGNPAVPSIAQACHGADVLSVLRPDVAVVTCAGDAIVADLPGEKAFEQIQVFDGLSASGTAVVNLDDRLVPHWLAQLKNKKYLTFSIYNTKPADVVLAQARYRPGKGSHLSVKTPRGEIELTTQLLGEHQWVNVLAAVAAVLSLEVDLSDIAAGVAATPHPHGCLVLRASCVDQWALIDDTAHASAISARAAIDVLATCKGRRILVVGTLATFEGDAVHWHRMIGQTARARMIDDVVAVGEMAEAVIEGFGGGSVAKTHTQAIDYLSRWAGVACTVLVKGAPSEVPTENMAEVVHAFAR
jgi:UDP-N-acetylmuramoyl-tripeptide--D-alanyl-D-alanine ligase